VDEQRADIEGFGDAAVAPALTRRRDVGLQQYPRPRQSTRGMLAGPDHILKLLTLLDAQPHNIFFHSDSRARHLPPPSFAFNDVNESLIP